MSEIEKYNRLMEDEKLADEKIEKDLKVILQNLKFKI